MELLVLSDASILMVTNCFLVYLLTNGPKKVSLVIHTSHLASKIPTIPKRELQSLAVASSLTSKVVEELGNLIKHVYVESD